MAIDTQEARRHVQRYERLLNRRVNFDTLWQEAAEFTLPHRSNITIKRAPGDRQTDRMFDSTATHAITLLTAVMAGSLTSQHLEWFHLKMREEKLNAVKEVQDWLEDAEQQMYLAFRQSNFHQEIHEAYVDLMFGTASLYIEERPRIGQGFGGFLFRALPIGSFVLDEAPDGTVDTLYRCYEMSAKAIVQQWGERKAGQTIREQAESGDDRQYEIVHCIYPRTLYDPQQRDAKNMPFASAYILRNPVKVLNEGGYEEFPAPTPRWSKTSDEMYGRGPIILALPEIRTVNAARMQFLRSAGKHIDPPVEIDHEGILGDLELFASGVNVRGPSATPGQPVIVPIETGGKLDWTQFVMSDERTLIKEMFFWDQLSLQTAGANPTATEIERRWEIMRRVLGPTLGRLESELLNPLIDRCFGLMLRANAFGEIPQILRQQGANIDVEYEGPLARSQRSGRLASFEQIVAMLMPLAQVKPEIWDNFDLDGAARDLASVAGLPNRYMTDRRKMAETRSARTQAMNEEAQFEKVTQGAEAAGKAAPALEMLAGMRNGQMGSAA